MTFFTGFRKTFTPSRRRRRMTTTMSLSSAAGRKRRRGARREDRISVWRGDLYLREEA
jgi:hypothetical protein